MGNEAACIRRPLMKAVKQNELVFRGHLHIVARLQLSILHVVFLHPHKRSIRVRLGVAVAIAKAGFLLLILSEPGQKILPNLFERLFQGTARLADVFPCLTIGDFR
ncbi:hypothetical protein D3C73_1310080 [compost metagenome]